MNRRGFLRSGAVLGMAGALIGAGSGTADAAPMNQAVPMSSGIPSNMPDLPTLPESYLIETDGVEISPTVRMVPGYDWRGTEAGAPPTVDMQREAWLHLTINGEKFQTVLWKPQEV